jgi:hypothetical protein
VKNKGIISLILALFGVLVVTYPVFAGGLTVYSGKIDDSVIPGNDYTYTMKVENTSDTPMDIGIEVKGYGMSGENTFVSLEKNDDITPYTARELLSVSPDSIHLEPGNSQDITVIAKIPTGIGDGGRYAIVLIHTIPKSGTVTTVSAIAARVLLTVDGSQLVHDSEILSVESIETEPLNMLMTVKNIGNHHYKPHIIGKLLDGDQVIATASSSDGWPIIPGFSRQYKLTFTSTEKIPAGNYETDIEVQDDLGNTLTHYSSSFEVQELYTPPTNIPTTIPQTTPETTNEQPTVTKVVKKDSSINWGLIIGAGIGIILVSGGMYLFGVRRGKGHSPK